MDSKKQELVDLEGRMAEPGFWDDHQKGASISRRAEMLRTDITQWEGLRKDADDLFALAEMTEESDTASWKQLASQYEDVKKRFEEVRITVHMSGLWDDRSAILSLHAGAGGDDAQDWTAMLFRMYMRYAEIKGWSTQVVEESKGAEAGFKKITIHIKGPRAYGFLKAESGVHRLVRISPFDAENMRHTSFALCEVIPDIEDEGDVVIRDEDIEIGTYRASGHGGQSVNTTDSAVRITHKPSGIVVTCQNERSQHQNKDFAMKMLRSKLAHAAELERQKKARELKGEHKSAEWGNQIRSYVLHPYKQVKDHRTKAESKNPDAVLDGDLDFFIAEFLHSGGAA